MFCISKKIGLFCLQEVQYLHALLRNSISPSQTFSFWLVVVIIKWRKTLSALKTVQVYISWALFISGYVYKLCRLQHMRTED